MAQITIILSKNGALVASNAAAMNSPPNVNMFILARNFEGSPGTYAGDRIAVAFIGGGLTDQNCIDLSAAINAYAVSWSFSTYTTPP